jgi:hypothetical protein
MLFHEEPTASIINLEEPTASIINLEEPAASIINLEEPAASTNPDEPTAPLSTLKNLLPP